MAIAFRAALAVVMLAGFYVLAVAQMAAGLALAIWLASVTSGVLAAKVGIAVFGATVWAVGYGTWKALRTKRSAPHGLAMDRAAAPHLWATVDELSAVVGTRAPDEIYLVPEVNAAVEEHTRLMGLIAGRRYMYIGMPLLQSFTTAQLRSVLAHELGHYSGRHTRLAAVSYRGRLALARTVSHIGNGNVAGWVFRGYARLYVLVENAVSRRQELAADRSSVQVAGRDAATSALREVGVLGAAFAFYLNRYVGPGLEAGYAPDDVFGGFDAMLQARTDEIAELRANQPADESSIWDTHPPLRTRLAAIMATPESATPADERPARQLVPDLVRAGHLLQKRVIDTSEVTVLPWDQFVTAAGSAALQEEMDGLLRTISRAIDQPVAHVGELLDQLAAGRLDDLAAPVFPQATRREARKLFIDPLTDLLSLAAVRSGVARWQHSWTGPARLVGPDGSPFDLSELAARAMDAATASQAREELARLGIDVTAAKHVEQRATAGRATIHGGIANMVVAKQRTDLLILSNGLMLVPGVPRLKMRTATRRIAQWMDSGDPRELSSVGGTRFIPYEEVARTELTRRFPLRYAITLHSGERMEIRWGAESEEVGDSSALLAEAMRVASGD